MAVFFYYLSQKLLNLLFMVFSLMQKKAAHTIQDYLQVKYLH